MKLKESEKIIWFDLDGTLVDLYGVEHWLEYLQAEDATPYRIARPLLPMATLARALHDAQRHGFLIGIISWTSKNGSPAFQDRIIAAKRSWLRRHLPSVQWDIIDIVPYGTPKHDGRRGILFDDNENIRGLWGAHAHNVHHIISVIRGLW